MNPETTVALIAWRRSLDAKTSARAVARGSRGTSGGLKGGREM